MSPHQASRPVDKSTNLRLQPSNQPPPRAGWRARRIRAAPSGRRRCGSPGPQPRARVGLGPVACAACWRPWSGCHRGPDRGGRPRLGERHRGRHTGDVVHLWDGQLLEQAPRVGRHRLQVPVLGLGVERPEGQLVTNSTETTSWRMQFAALQSAARSPDETLQSLRAELRELNDGL